MATKRLIDPDELLEEINEVYSGRYERAYDQTIHDFYNSVRRRIRRCSTVDAVEVVHGRFEAIRYGYGCLQIATCSVCGEMQGLYINGRLPSWNYCPNCGAKMDGDGNG